MHINVLSFSHHRFSFPPSPPPTGKTEVLVSARSYVTHCGSNPNYSFIRLLTVEMFLSFWPIEAILTSALAAPPFDRRARLASIKRGRRLCRALAGWVVNKNISLAVRTLPCNLLCIQQVSLGPGVISRVHDAHLRGPWVFSLSLH